MECSRRDLGLVIAGLLAPRGLFSGEEMRTASQGLSF